MKPVSVIIPLAKGEEAWRDLLDQLELPEGSEIILATGEQPLHVDENAYEYSVRVVKEGQGRAGQMNAGARVAKTDWLWFLHADTRLGGDVVGALNSCICGDSNAIFFFDLKFANDGPAAMSWNEWTVRWRAGQLKLPFGDQAFLLRRDIFQKLGAYREDLSSGEDHILVWKAHQMGVPVVSSGASVYTSARRYADRGWLKTTLTFVFLTIRQAAPQWFILYKLRLKRIFE